VCRSVLAQIKSLKSEESGLVCEKNMKQISSEYAIIISKREEITRAEVFLVCKYFWEVLLG